MNRWLPWLSIMTGTVLITAGLLWLVLPDNGITARMSGQFSRMLGVLVVLVGVLRVVRGYFKLRDYQRQARALPGNGQPPA